MASHSAHFWHPHANPNEIKERAPVHIVSADGVYLQDSEGRRLLDGNSGGLWCVNVGHNRPEIKAAIMRQLDELEFYQIFDGISHPRAAELAAKLVAMTQVENMKRVFFTNGGSDSNETALKLARQYHVINGQPERKKFISLKGAYHGCHFGASTLSALTAFRRLYEPVLPGVTSVEMPLLYRNPWNCTDPEQLVKFCIDQLIAEINYQSPDTIAAIMAEPVNGLSVAVPPATYWPRLREVCDQYGILLIADEVITGFGRSGSLFGCRGWGVIPDMMSLAKGISSGYIPLGAVMINARMEQAWDSIGNDPKAHIATGVTYAGHPVACAAALANLEIVEKERLPENAQIQGEYLLNLLRPFTDKFRSVGDVRGKGLMIALDFVVDKKTREPIDPTKGFGYRVASVGREQGIMVRPYGPRIILSPPLVFSTEHCDQLVTALERALEVEDR
jgi:adenosylmethionine-8-amino-7-oxononanoate aminotransferase